MSDLDKLNPKPEVVLVGIREYEDLNIWPLSMADQLDLGEIIDSAVVGILEETSDNLTFVMAIRHVVQNNLLNVIKMVTDYDTDVKAKKLLKKITNDQFVDICEKVYVMNFEKISKNVLSLLEKLNIPLTRRPLPMSLNNTQDTDSSTSSDSPTEQAG